MNGHSKWKCLQCYQLTVEMPSYSPDKLSCLAVVDQWINHESYSYLGFCDISSLVQMLYAFSLFWRTFAYIPTLLFSWFLIVLYLDSIKIFTHMYSGLIECFVHQLCQHFNMIVLSRPKNGVYNLHASKTHLRIVYPIKSTTIHWYSYNNTVPLSNAEKTWILCPV